MTDQLANIASRNLATTSHRFAMVVFSAAIFLSASLLFWVEPLFSKMVLPVLGGSAAVWSVAMVVFQGLMLAGYLYAHLLTRYLSISHAVLVHALVLAATFLSLPIAIVEGIGLPPETGLPLWLIGVFLASIGLPFFALAANAPLLQAWFAQGNSQNAYFLYRASNLGSFLVLLAYPFAIEPNIGLVAQSQVWTACYLALFIVVTASGVLAVRTPAIASAVRINKTRAAISWRDRVIWAALGFVPSGILIAVTAHIATDVASGPYIWILPLALYLLTFVFAFSDKPLFPPRLMLTLQPATTALLVILLLWGGKVNWTLSLAGHLVAFFVAAMVCHAELYRRRPAAEELTQFYVYMSLGGVLGGVFTALMAPLLFSNVFEYPLLAVAALLVRPNIWTTPRTLWIKDLAFVAAIAGAIVVALITVASLDESFIVVMMTVSAVMALQGRAPARLLPLAALLFFGTSFYDPTNTHVVRMRSFYNVYKIVDLPPGKFRVLYQGTTAHGVEQVRGDDGALLNTRPEPLAYYYKGGPYNEAIEAVRALHGGALPQVALVGLGMGAQSCASKPGETWTYYELDPMIVAIAHDRSLFRSMTMCSPAASVVVGDGRLTLRQGKAEIDLLIMDTFSSDSVPLHMLTREAFAMYLSRLSPHGIIAFHITNKNMKLSDVVAASAASNGMVAVVKRDSKAGDDLNETLHFPAEIAVVARTVEDLDALRLSPDWRVVTPAAGTRVWTDDYSNVLTAILNKMREGKP